MNRLVSRLKAHAPELITVIAVIVAIVTVELRRAAIRLSPEPRTWSFVSGAAYPRLMYDSSGDKLVIAGKPERIVSQTLGSDELLFGVCAGDRLVGASPFALDERYSNVATQVRSRSLPLVMNVEQVVELRPDIVFVASYSSAEQVDLLRTTAIGVFRLSNFDRIEGIMSNIRAVGYAVGEDRCAAALVQRMEQRISQIARVDAAHAARPRAMLYGQSAYTAGTDTLIDEILHVVGARNVAAEHGIRGSTRISAEAVALWQPDFLIVGAPRGEFERVRHALMSEPAIAGSPAGRTNRIIVIDDRFLLCVSQYIVSAIQALSDGLYGDTRTSSAS